MKTRIRIWDNSLALRIPESFAAQAGIKKESPVEMSLEGGKLIITLVSKPKPTLKQLLAKITPQNIHHEVHTGPSEGQEIW